MKGSSAPDSAAGAAQAHVLLQGALQQAGGAPKGAAASVAVEPVRRPRDRAPLPRGHIRDEPQCRFAGAYSRFVSGPREGVGPHRVQHGACTLSRS